jgi:hypothetical protein
MPPPVDVIAEKTELKPLVAGVVIGVVVPALNPPTPPAPTVTV